MGALVRVQDVVGQDACISEQYGGHTPGQSCGTTPMCRVRHIGRRCVEGDKAREPDGALVRVQGVAGHCGDEDEEDEQQRAVRGQHMAQVVCRHQWKSCGTDSGESSSNMYATPQGSMVIVRVQGVVCHRGR